MANPTSNYGFVLPTSTDLVTDLPADFDVALQGVDTRLKALQPGTTLGDLAYSSATANTNTRLGVGSTGQVLTVSGGVPTWATATAAGSNFTLLNAGGTALTGATTVTVSGISTRNKIFIYISGAGTGAAGDIVRLRFNTDTGNNYTFFGIRLNAPSTYNATVHTAQNTANVGFINFGQMSGSNTSLVSGYALIDGCGSSGIKQLQLAGTGNDDSSNAQAGFVLGGIYNSASTISSISVVSSGSNFNAGTVFVYTSA